MIDLTRLYALTDEMDYAAKNKGLDERALRARFLGFRGRLEAIVANSTSAK